MTDEYFYDTREPFQRYSVGEPYGSKSTQNVTMYRPYHPLTHFREHLRRYMGERFQYIPEELLKDLRGKIDPMHRDAFWHVKSELKSLRHKKYKVQYWDRGMRRYYVKEYSPQKFYKDIFSIILLLFRGNAKEKRDETP